MREISPNEAFELIRNGSAEGIDVREQSEWDAGRAPYVQLNPMSAFDSSRLPSSKPVIFMCRSGNRSGQVAAFVENNSGLEVMNMTGGMMAWQSAGLPLESAQGPGGTI